MVSLPKEVKELVNTKGTTNILVTANKAGQPHAIVCGSVSSPDDNTVVVGQIMFKTAAKYLKENDKASFLSFNGGKAYEIQVKVRACLDSGEQYDKFNEALAAAKFHANALWVFDVTAVTNESPGPDAGKKLA